MPTVVAFQPRFKPMPQKFEVSCASCNLRELCLPAGLCADDLARVENVVYARRRVKRGEALFNAGGQFNAVYAIRSGFFKASVIDGEGREQVTGFFMGGELVGLDGLGSGTYNASAVARSQFLQKSSDRASYVEYFALRAELDVTTDEFFLLPVVSIHYPVEETREHAPVCFFAVRDVLVIVESLDVLDIQPRVLITKPAARTGDEGERPGFAGEIVLSREEGCAIR